MASSQVSAATAKFHPNGMDVFRSHAQKASAGQMPVGAFLILVQAGRKYFLVLYQRTFAIFAFALPRLLLPFLCGFSAMYLWLPHWRLNRR
jgi:hypothetical protein